MALIRQSSIQAVLDACDMLEIVSPYTTLKKSGSNYMGRCPFHGEKTPSFSVDPAQKLYYCFGCGEGGNAFSFVEKQEGLQFVDAVRSLADKYGIRLEYEKTSPHQEEMRRSRERIFTLLEQTAFYYSRYLWDSPSAAPARDYLEKRGFKKQTARDFRLGFAPPGGTSLLRAAQSKGYTPEELMGAGLMLSREGRAYDRFRGRLMFPFTDYRGHVLGFGARVLDDSKPKYLNSPESAVYHKSNLVFGLGNARQAIARDDHVFVVEGYTDVLALRQLGIVNAVASMGTALTENQLKEISRLTRNIYLAFDADFAGQAAMLRALELAKQMRLSVKVVVMPSGKDPADLIHEDDGKKAFSDLAASASSLLQYQVQATLSASDLENVEGRVKAFAALQNVIKNAANSLERDEQLRIIADRLRLGPENVAYLMESASSSSDEEDGETKRRVLSQEEIAERSFLSLCLARPGEAGRYLQDMTEAHFTTELNRSAFKWVKGRLGGIASGSDLTAVDISADSGARSILPELVIRAETEQSAAGALPELYFRLCEAELLRRINSLKGRLSQDDETSADFRELCRLEARRRKIIELIQAGSYETV